MSDWTRIAKFAGLIGSAHDGEALNAARALGRALESQGLTWADLAQRITYGTDAIGAARTTAERRQSERREAWEARMAEEEERARQSSARRKGREW